VLNFLPWRVLAMRDSEVLFSSSQFLLAFRERRFLFTVQAGVPFYPFPAVITRLLPGASRDFSPSSQLWSFFPYNLVNSAPVNSGSGGVRSRFVTRYSPPSGTVMNKRQGCEEDSATFFAARAPSSSFAVFTGY